MKNSKNIFRFAALLAVAAIVAAMPVEVSAQKKHSDDKRKEMLNDMRNYKHECFKKGLSLTREQETPFFNAYDQMDDEIMKIGEETRALERKISADANANDTEMETAARALFEQKKKEAEVELKYFEDFKKILTKRQLLKYKETERRMLKGLISKSKSKHKD